MVSTRRRKRGLISQGFAVEILNAIPLTWNEAKQVTEQVQKGAVGYVPAGVPNFKTQLGCKISSDDRSYCIIKARWN